MDEYNKKMNEMLYSTARNTQYSKLDTSGIIDNFKIDMMNIIEPISVTLIMLIVLILTLKPNKSFKGLIIIAVSYILTYLILTKILRSYGKPRVQKETVPNNGDKIMLLMKLGLYVFVIGYIAYLVYAIMDFIENYKDVSDACDIALFASFNILMNILAILIIRRYYISNRSLIKHGQPGFFELLRIVMRS